MKALTSMIDFEDEVCADRRLIDRLLSRFPPPSTVIVRQREFGLEGRYGPAWHLHLLLTDGHWWEDVPSKFSYCLAQLLIDAKACGQMHHLPVLHYETLSEFNEIVEWESH